MNTNCRLSINHIAPDGMDCQAEVAALRQHIAVLEQQVAALQAENEHLRMVADLTYDWQYWIDPAGKMYYVSSACERMTGYGPAEFQADAGLLERSIHPDDHERVVRHLHNEQHQPSVADLQFRIITRNGEQRWISHTCQPVYSATGAWLGHCASNRDITTWVQAEETYRMLVETSLPGLIIFQDGRFAFVNSAMVDIVGYSREELLAFTPDTIHQLLHPDDYKRIMGYTCARQTGRTVPQSYEIRLIRKDGTTRWVEIAVSLTTYRSRPATQVAYIDITDRKRVEEALRASEQQIRLIGNNLPNGIIYQLRQATDGTCTFTYMSDAVERLTGYTAEEIIARPALVLDSHHEDDQAGYVAAMAAAAGTLQPMDFELRQYVADGTLRWRQFYSTPRREPDGTIIWDGICIDITERKQAEEAYRTLVENSLQALVIFQDGRNVFANPAAAHITGYTQDELLAMSPEDANQVIHPNDRALLAERACKRQDGQDVPPRYEFRLIRKDGAVRQVECFNARITYQGNPAVQMTYVDITERKQAEETLQRQRQFLRQVIDSNPAIICACDRTGRFTLVNQTLADVYGTTVEALLGKTDPKIHLGTAEVAQIHQEDQQIIATGTELVIPEQQITDASGQTRYLSIVKQPLSLTDGPADQVLIVATDITARKLIEIQLQRANEQLQQQVIRDPLTGLYNRRYLDATLPRELQRAERHGQQVAIMMLDIDHFKHFNDTYGHDAGDMLLREMGTFLRTHTRGEDIACRYGGEEFTLVLPGASLADTLLRAETIRTAIRTLMVYHQGQPLTQVTASFGVAVFPGHGTSTDMLIRTADQALYQAKRTGRDRVVVAAEMPAHNGEQ